MEVMVGMGLMVGIGGIWGGLRNRERTQVGTWTFRWWKRQLVNWYAWPSETPPESERTLMVRWMRALAPIQVTVGIGSLVGVVTAFLLAHLADAMLSSSRAGLFAVSSFPIVWTFAVISAAALRYGMLSRARHYRPLGTRGRYQPILILSLTVVAGGFCLGMAALLTLGIVPRDTSQFSLNAQPPSSSWLLWITPILTLATVAVAQYAVSRANLLPDEPLADDPKLQASANAGLRALRVAIFTFIIAYLGYSCGWAATTWPLPFDPTWVRYIPEAIMFFGVMELLLVLLLSSSLPLRYLDGPMVRRTAGSARARCAGLLRARGVSSRRGRGGRRGGW